MRLLPGLLLLGLAGCASYPQLVMVNRQTGATVDCRMPDVTAGPKDFLVSHACLAACEARGFLPVPGVAAPVADGGIPDVCAD